MIARIWRGTVRATDADAYREYLEPTGLRAYRETPGNRGAWLLRRIEGARCEIVTLSFWESMDAVRRFAGDDPEQAVFYPEDDRFLVERDLRVAHYELFEY